MIICLPIRPSNWVERIASLDSTFINGRLVYNGGVVPIYKDGKLCAKVNDPSSEAYRQLIKVMEIFASDSISDIRRVLQTTFPELEDWLPEDGFDDEDEYESN